MSVNNLYMLSYVFLFYILTLRAEAKLNELYRWKQMNFANLPDYVLKNIPSSTNLTTLFDKTTFIPYNNVPNGVSHYKGKIIISIARRQYGVPSTLNIIETTNVPRSEKSPDLQGYPDYETNAISANLKVNPDQIISVYRTRVDVCGRLWFVDTGLLEYPGNFIQVQRPSIWVIDLATNQRIRRFEIPASVAAIGDGFITITVDAEINECDKAFAYLPNLRTYRISVYSFEKNDLWTFGHNYFHLEPLNGDFDILGIKFRWSDGPFSVALGPKQRSGYRTAYIHAFASLSEYKVSTSILQNSSLASFSYQGTEFEYLGYRGERMQSAAHDIDVKSETMIFSANQHNAIGCWNLNKPFIPNNMGHIDENNVTMVYPTDLKVDSDSNIFVLTNNLPFYIYRRLNINEYNFRIWKISVANAISRTVCEESPIFFPPCCKSFN